MGPIMSTLLPTRVKESGKGKEKEPVIAPELRPIFERAHTRTELLLKELPIRMRGNSTTTDHMSFIWMIQEYRRVYDKFEKRGDLHKLEVLTALFDFHGVMELLQTKIDLDTLVSYAIRTLQCNAQCSTIESGHSFFVYKTESTEDLFEASGLPMSDHHNVYIQYTDGRGQSYWIRESTVSVYCTDASYWFVVDSHRLSNVEAVRQMLEAIRDGYDFHDEDNEPISRQQFLSTLKASKL